MSKLYFDESLILLNVAANTKEELLEKLGRNLQEQGLAKESFIPAIIQREQEFATGLPTAGVSVAIPHTDAEHVIRKSISVAVLDQPVNFGVMGDDSETTPVRLVFMLAMDESHAQLSLLQKLMSVFQEEGLLQELVDQQDKMKLKNILIEKLGLA